MFSGSTAGRSSMRKFRQARQANMRQQWGALAFGAATIVGCTVWIVFGSGWGRAFAEFVLGVFLTGVFFAWNLGFNAHSLRWAWGAFGEQWTAEELAKLDGSWHVFHDIPSERGNWDHVVIGLPGVFVIDSKFLTEPAVVDERGLRSGRLRAGGGASSRGSARRINEIIERNTGRSVWVQGAVAVWGQLPEGVVERDKVLYMPAAQVVETLERRSPRL